MAGKLIAFSAPSGAGKTTLVRKLIEAGLDLEFSVSACTRPKRDNETDGVDYHFITAENFRKRISNNEFLEWQEVYPGSYYGTLKSEVEKIWERGKHVIFDVDVKGGISLKKYFDDKAISIFIMPPSIEELERRLNLRATDDAETIVSRLAKAGEEMTYKDHFDEILVNDDLQVAKDAVVKVIENFLAS